MDLLCGLLTHCSEERCFSKLAEVVKLARDQSVKLDKKFYKQVLPALQQWGQDQEALSEVSRHLQLVEGRGGAPDVVGGAPEAVLSPSRVGGGPTNLPVDHGSAR